jgi:hypothetical protein
MSAAIVPSRLFPIAKALAAIGLAVSLLDLLLAAVFGATPRGMPPPFDPATITRFCGRVAAFEKMRAAGQVADRQLVAVVGVSTSQTDLDPGVLTASDPRKQKWLVVGTGGRNFTQLSLYSQPLLESAITPRLVVLAIHPFMLRSDERDEWDRPIDPIEHLRQFQLSLLAKDFCWLDRNHGRLEDESNLLVLKTADRLRGLVGLPMYDWYQVDDRPFDYWNAEYVVGNKAGGDYLWTQRHMFQRELVPGQFVPDNGQPQALRALVEKMRARGSKVVCVLMPEGSEFRSWSPPIVAARFADAIAGAATPENPLRVVDMRQSMPDDVFYDYVHLNNEGRRRFSTLLVTRLADQ